MHLLMVPTMVVLGLATVLAALAEARHRAPASHWGPHLAMGAAMTGAHVADRSLLWTLWTGGAALAAAAVWTGIRHGGSENQPAHCVDLASCAILLCASAGGQGTGGPSTSLEAHHSGSGTALHAAASLIALLTALAWGAARSVIHVRASRGAAHRPAAGGARTWRRTTLVARATGLVMVPLMAGTVIWS